MYRRLHQIEIKKVRENFKESDEHIVAWVSPDEAARRVREVELKSLLVEFTTQGRQPGKGKQNA